jgi:hypothetical protein
MKPKLQRGLSACLFRALLLLLGCLPGALPAATVGNGVAQYVVHISADGLGGVFLRDYLAQYPEEFPSFIRLWCEGAGTFNARCDYNISVTEPNHTSILTGRPVLQQPTNVLFSAPHGFDDNYDPGPPATLHNMGNLEVPYKASVFDVTHDHGLRTAFFAGKDKFALFIRSYDVINGAPDTVGEDNGANKMDVASSSITARRISAFRRTVRTWSVRWLKPSALIRLDTSSCTSPTSTSWVIGTAGAAACTVMAFNTSTSNWRVSWPSLMPIPCWLGAPPSS